MSEELKIVYKLYALESTEENRVEATKHRFSRIASEPFPGYVLIYESGEKPKDAIEITGATVDRLTEQDEQWIRDCNLVVLTEEAKKHESEIVASMSRRIEELEKALESEKQKLEG